MELHDTIRSLAQEGTTRIILLVMDGLGDLPAGDEGGPTPLEAAATPHLDALASANTTGLVDPVHRGITPGSGPGHLGLFGYDPLCHPVGRGVLAALGIGLELSPGAVAARGNLCTLDDEGRVTDRRAGRPDDATGRKLVAQLEEAAAGVDVAGVTVRVHHVKEYRFVLVCEGGDLGAAVSDTDPQEVGVPPREPTGRDEADRRTAAAAAAFAAAARERLRGVDGADGVLLRGFDRRPDLPQLGELCRFEALAVAAYPMYRGLARLVGMALAPPYGSLAEAAEQVAAAWADRDFFFVHAKDTDRAGEDGDVAAKIAAIEAVDALVPKLMELGPDVLAVTGDHSTPCRLGAHSWHPVPLLLAAPTCRPDGVHRFGERACIAGGLGRLRAVDLLPELLAHAGRLAKYGA